MHNDTIFYVMLLPRDTNFPSYTTTKIVTSPLVCVVSVCKSLHPSASVVLTVHRRSLLSSTALFRTALPVTEPAVQKHCKAKH